MARLARGLANKPRLVKGLYSRLIWVDLSPFLDQNLMPKEAPEAGKRVRESPYLSIREGIVALEAKGKRVYGKLSVHFAPPCHRPDGRIAGWYGWCGFGPIQC